MAVKEVALLPNGLREAGVIRDYALLGAVAQMRYTETVSTFDADADVTDYEGIPLRVVRPGHLAAIALSVGRLKDFNRIPALLDAGAVSLEETETLATPQGLAEKWMAFRKRFLDE